MVATYMDATPGEKQEVLETIDLKARLERVSHIPRTGSRCCDYRRKSAARPRRRSTLAIARHCCASRWRRSNVNWAKATRARRPRPTSQGDRRCEDRPRSRGPGAQGAVPPVRRCPEELVVEHGMGAHLSRLAPDRTAMGASAGKHHRHRIRPAHPRRRPFGLDKISAHHRVSRRSEAPPQLQAPILCLPIGPPASARLRSANDRAAMNRNRTPARRRSRRGGYSPAPRHRYRRAARQQHTGDPQDRRAGLRG